MIDEPADVHPFLMYLAYKYVGLAVLLVEASFNAERLNLPIERPILNRQLTNKFIDDPKTPGGRIDVGVYSFAEQGGSTPYHVIVRLEDGSIIPYSRLPPDERNEKLSHEKSLIDTNGAYQLAVAWLKAIDVDVEELGRTNRAEVQQRWFWSGQKAATKVSIPLFDVRWGKWDEPKVEVSIDGRTKEFIELQQHDGSI